MSATRTARRLSTRARSRRSTTSSSPGRGCVTLKRSRTARTTRGQAAREWAQKADELEKTAQAIDNEPDRPTFVAPKLKALADQLDDKARLLEEAAQKQVDAANQRRRGRSGCRVGQ